MKLLLIFFILLPLFSYSQNVGIGTNAPDGSAKLEIQSTEGGLLIPRLSSQERDAIPLPLATGLLIYNSESNSFEYWNGNQWSLLGFAEASEVSDSDSDTRITTEENVDEDVIRFQIKGQEHLRLDSAGLYLNHKLNSIFIGEGAGRLDDGNNSNILIGKNVGKNNVGGTLNVIVGLEAGSLLNGGGLNTILGAQAASDLSTGNKNVAIGYTAGRFLNTGESNILIGRSSGLNVKAGNRNVYIGDEAGANNNNGSDNVYIGFNAGAIETGSNKLHIGNVYNNSLIYGEFDNQKVKVNGGLESTGKLRVGDDLEVPEEGAIKYDSDLKTFFGYNGTSWVPFSNSSVLNDNKSIRFPIEPPMNSDLSGHRMAIEGDYVVSGGAHEIAIYKLIENGLVIDYVSFPLISKGMSVDISNDKVVTGVPELLENWENGIGQNVGGLCFFNLVGGVWQFDDCITVAGTKDLGVRVAMDGEFVIANDDVVSGFTIIFENVNGNWLNRFTFGSTPTNRVLAVDISGSTAAILTQEATSPNIYQTSVNFFVQAGSTWVADGSLLIGGPSSYRVPSEVSRYDNFYSTASFILEGDELFVTNTDDALQVFQNGRLFKSGEVQCFKRTNNAWNLVQTISPDLSGKFGLPIKFSGERLAIGAKGFVEQTFDDGELYWSTIFYERGSAGLWVESERHNFANVKALSNSHTILELRRPKDADLEIPDDNRLFKF